VSRATSVAGPLPIDGQGADTGDVGGKGAWLDRLVGAGFAVPPTVALGTDVYRAVTDGVTLRRLVAELKRAQLPPPEEHEQARRSVDEAFSTAPLPDDVSRAIRAAGAAVRAPGQLVAARSSATAEDLHGTSFAGQYRSFLSLDDDAALERAVRLVWASLWHPAPRAYRRFHGVVEDDLAMAVIVMQQVTAVASGVAFTVDPAGHPDVIRVELVRGLGEQLVSGAVTPEVHLVPRDGLGSGTARPTVPSSGIVPAEVSEVAEMALLVEQAFGEPQDLEWARDDKHLWLLQARPVTAGSSSGDDGFDTPGAAGRRWTTAGIVEMVPGVLPPLRFEVCHLLLEEALRAHEASLGTLPPEAEARPLLGRVRARAALDADLLEDMGRRGGDGGWLAALRRTRRLVRARRRALWEGGSVTVAAIELLGLLPDPADLDDGALLALRRRVLDLAGRAMTAEVAVAAAATGADDRLRATLGRHLDPEDAATWATRVTARPQGTVAGWPAERLTRLVAAATPEAATALAGSTDPATAAARLTGAPGGPELLEGIRRLLRRAGSAAVFAGPTWEELLDDMWATVRPLLTEGREATEAISGPRPDSTEALEELLEGLAATAEWRRTRVLTAQVIDLRRLLLRRQAEDTADLLERRERVKSAVLTLGGVVRRLHLTAGRRLVDRGVLEHPADVELLSEHEFTAAVLGTAPAPPSWAELARRRRWLAACDEAGPLPARFEGIPPPSPSPPAPDGDVLRGWGAAPGRLSGTARVLHHPTDGGLERGDVLVARTTDASWAPLFMVAGAVVVEEGGPLSHAAIVARELGIPAVLNLPGVVSRLAAHRGRVAVDGDGGTVTLLRDDSA
jgi:rifampicin phosphotransferase